MMSFAHAFYILLSPKQDFSLDTCTVNDDPNNPWNLVTLYQIYDGNSTNASKITII